MVANIAALVDKARQRGAGHLGPAFHETAHGQRRLALRPELTIGESEPVVHKRYADSFEDTDLESGAGRAEDRALVVAGAQTDECIRSTLHGAIVRGYDATLVGRPHHRGPAEWGAPTPDKVIDHTNLYWGNHAAPGREAGTVTTEAVSFG